MIELKGCPLFANKAYLQSPEFLAAARELDLEVGQGIPDALR